jgi:ArsR family transcriptional regulator
MIVDMVTGRVSVERAVRVAKALGDATRFELLLAIADRPDICCRDLVALFPVAQATVSHHLKVLGDAGLIVARREGPFGYYRLRHEVLEELLGFLAKRLGRRSRPRRSPTRAASSAAAKVVEVQVPGAHAPIQGEER